MTAAVAAIASEARLLDIAAEMGIEAARRYRWLAAWWRAQGERDLAAVFTELAETETRHAADPRPSVSDAPVTIDDSVWRSALLTPYRALSLAVREKERAFAFYVEISAHAETPAVRALAEDLARMELDHAAILRRRRRAAFHRERAYPTPPLPADPAALENQSAIWEAQVAAASGHAERLRALSRNAERYMEVAEQAKHEALLEAAQRLAAQTLRQLAAERAGSGAF